jgi:excisionase family DNA binding protein
MDEILTVPEIAEYLKVSRSTVWRWCSEGKLPAFKMGKIWRVHRAEIEKIVGQNLGTPEKNLTAIEDKYGF